MVRVNQATAEVFFTDFRALNNDEREAFLEKVVADSRLREELLEIALIEEAKRVKGKAVSAGEYFARPSRKGQY